MGQTLTDHAGNRHPEIGHDGATRKSPGFWGSVRQFGGGGFRKGALIIGVAFVAVTAIVLGWMGSNGELAVGNQFGARFVNAEEGFAVGVSKVLKYLFTSGIGLATLAIGGITGALMTARGKQKELATAEQTEHLAQELEIARAMQPQKTVEKTVESHVTNNNTHELQTHSSHREYERDRERADAADQEKWSSCEIKRRSEAQHAINDCKIG